MNSYPKLFSPLTVKRMTLRNRVVMPPMGTNFGDQSGEATFIHLDYYEQRAAGGTGLIIVENASVYSPQGSNGTTQIRIDHDSYLPRLCYLCEVVHKHGCNIAVQINHAGASAIESRTGMQPVSASDVPTKEGNNPPRPLEREEINMIVKKYGEAAKRAVIAGFDAVEIHAGHSYLISQFLSPLTNKRTDEFGGCPENRARIATMIMAEVRKMVGPMFPIMLRISADEFVEGGNTQEDMLELLQYFQEEADIIDVSAALNPSIQYQIDACHLADGWKSYLSKAVKEKYQKPVMISGNIRDPKVAERIIENSEADLIGIGRGLIADPNWVNKVMHGKEEELRKCISCNIGCAGHRIGLNRPIRCTVNPMINVWEDYKKHKVEKPCNVVVIGGGVAGLEAACTAAEVGCTTFLLEKNEVLGGLALEISKIPDKYRIADFPRYLENRTKNLHNLIVFKGKEATADFVGALKPDLIVNATGSEPLLPPIEGLKDNVDQGRVYSILRMIQERDSFGEKLDGKKVVIIGGGAVGLDVAEFFAPRGAEVAIVEMLPEIGRDLDPISKSRMAEIFRKYDVKQKGGTRLNKVEADKFLVTNPDGTAEELPFDYGFVCLGMKSKSPHLAEIEEHFAAEDVEFLNVGDAVRARRIIEGVGEGRNILSTLHKNGFLKQRF